MIEAVLALLGSISGEAWAWLGGAIATIAGTWWLRRDAAQDERDRLRADAAAAEKRVREVADAAARDAARDGASGRLRGGSF